MGGFLYAVNPILVYALCCTLYITSSFLIGMVKAERNVSSREPISLAVLFAGFRYIRHNPVILGTISLDLFAVVLGGVYALLPVFARDVFHVDSWGLGLLAGVARRGRADRRRDPRALSAAPMGRARSCSAPSRSMASPSSSSRCRTSFLLSMALLAVLGFSDMLNVVIRMTLIQLETTDDMRGRVSAVNSLFIIASNQLGDFRAGLMAAWLGTIPAVMVGGAGALLVALIGRKVFAALYRVETLDIVRR